ncbi:MAG: VOC family protein [Bryobacteraceae bacterium]|jgi:catechol 2,3-dioxygenase-like lactoylglutathione lyase family enzyme
MEAIIAKLLQDFEEGRMSRRQLIRSLAVTASAAAAVTPAVAAAPPDEPAFKAVAVNHISYQVADYAKTRDFYVSMFGMKVTQDTGRQCYLSFGDTFLLPRNGRPDSKTPPPHVDHIAYTIDTWNKADVEAELKRRGLAPRPDTEDSFHVKDPDGFDLQISGRNMKP